MVTGVGAVSVNLPLAFDTGSAGITLNAQEIFPSTMVTSAGFVFPPGQNSLTYHGITVTNQQAIRLYGGSGGKTEIGNIGFTQVTFAEGLTTDVMPVFLYYSVIETATGTAAAPQPQQGWFGVNAAADLIVVSGTAESAIGYPECSPSTTGSCRVVSVFKYLQYGEQVNAGFTLNPATLETCDIRVSGECQPQPALTVGLAPTVETGFTEVTLECPPTGYTGPEVIRGYLVCDPDIPDTKVTLAGPVTATLSESVLFDTGNPAVSFYQASSTLPLPLPAETLVSVTTPSDFTFTYTTAASGITETSIGAHLSSGIGIAFFTTHSFFIDFTTNTEGWM